MWVLTMLKTKHWYVQMFIRCLIEAEVRGDKNDVFKVKNDLADNLSSNGFRMVINVPKMD